MQLKIYQVDAFSERIFGGNPAAVVPLEEWLDDAVLQKIALENNLSETAFYVKKGEEYQLRWFTPATEVDLCGHATLATAHVLFAHEGHKTSQIVFFSPRSGQLLVDKKNGQYVLDFPVDTVDEISLSDSLLEIFEPKPIEAFQGKSDIVLVFQNESQISELAFDLSKIEKVPVRGIVATAPGSTVDFVSRWFGPQVGVPEDPVTGSAHTTLTPIWAKKLGKKELNAVQLSPRQGELTCQLIGDRVLIAGRAVTYLKGEIFI